jgi:hypothetical protein
LSAVYVEQEHGRVEGQLHAFLIYELDGREWSDLHRDLFNPREKAPVPTGCEAGWAPTDGMDAVENKQIFARVGNIFLFRSIVILHFPLAKS